MNSHRLNVRREMSSGAAMVFSRLQNSATTKLLRVYVQEYRVTGNFDMLNSETIIM